MDVIIQQKDDDDDNDNDNLISRDLLKQRRIKNQERFIARRFGVIVTPLSRD